MKVWIIKFEVLALCILPFGLETCVTGTNSLPLTSGQVTDWPGQENNPRFSPDGMWIAFDAEVDGNTDIYIQHREHGEVVRLTGETSEDRQPSWSPDGTHLAYLTDRTGDPSVWIVNVDGTDDQLIYQGNSVRLGGPNWSPDGTRLVMTQVSQKGKGNPQWGRATVLMISADGEQATELTTGGDEWWPHWDVNSEWVYYFVGLTDEIKAVHSWTGEVRSISNGRYIGWRPVPSPDRKSVLFVSELNQWHLWIAPLDGAGSPVQLTQEGSDDVPSFSPDGKQVIFSSNRVESPVIKLDIESGDRETLHHNGKGPQQLKNGNIVFRSAGQAGWDLLILNPESGSTRLLDVSISPLLDAVYSPQNNLIAAVTMGPLNGHYRIEILSSDGMSTGNSITFGDAEAPVWCEDNETLLFSSRGPEREVWLQVWSFYVPGRTLQKLTDSVRDKRPSGCLLGGNRILNYLLAGASGIQIEEQRSNKWQVVDSLNGQAGRWSPDGSMLAYVGKKEGQTDLFIRDSTGAIHQVTDDDLVEELPRWTLDGNHLLFSASHPNRNIWMISVPDLPW